MHSVCPSAPPSSGGTACCLIPAERVLRRFVVHHVRRASDPRKMGRLPSSLVLGTTFTAADAPRRRTRRPPRRCERTTPTVLPCATSCGASRLTLRDPGLFISVALSRATRLCLTARGAAPRSAEMWRVSSAPSGTGPLTTVSSLCRAPHRRATCMDPRGPARAVGASSDRGARSTTHEQPRLARRIGSQRARPLRRRVCRGGQRPIRCPRCASFGVRPSASHACRHAGCSSRGPPSADPPHGLTASHPQASWVGIWSSALAKGGRRSSSRTTGTSSTLGSFGSWATWARSTSR